MPEHRKQLTAGPEEIVVDIGELRSGKESPVRLVLTNGTAIGLEVAEISASCGCVVGKAEKKKVPPGGNIEIDAMLKPTSIVDLFEQKMVLHFTGGVISPKEILLRARVIGDVEVTPRTLQGDCAMLRNLGDLVKHRCEPVPMNCLAMHLALDSSHGTFC